MSKLPIEYLKHILDECNFIETALPEKISFDDFIRDETLKRAVVRSLEIIGEATKKIPADIKIKWSEVQWKFIAGMRDKLIHDYFGISYNIVWDVVKNKLPLVKETIQLIIEDLNIK